MTQWKAQESAVLFCSPFGKSLGTYLQQLSQGFPHTRTRRNDRKVQMKYVSHLLLGFGFATKCFKYPDRLSSQRLNGPWGHSIRRNSNWEEHHFRIKKSIAMDFQSTTKFK